MHQQQAQNGANPAPQPQTDFHILSYWTPERGQWSALELMNGNPTARVRQALGGRWTKTSGDLIEDMASSYVNATNNRKVFVLRLPRGLTREAAVRIMRAQ